MDWTCMRKKPQKWDSGEPQPSPVYPGRGSPGMYQKRGWGGGPWGRGRGRGVGQTPFLLWVSMVDASSLAPKAPEQNFCCCCYLLEG